MENILNLDHLLIWVSKDAPECKLFNDKGFTSIIEGSHKGQGTSGKYIFFLNFYIELLYISDNIEASNNLDKFGCDYIKRSNWRENSSSPFGLGLKMPSFKDKIPFDYIGYKADWMLKDGLIMALDNNDLCNPLIFLLYPYMEFPNYRSIQEMMQDDKPEDFKENHIHQNGIKSLTSYEVFVNSKSDLSVLCMNLNNSGIHIVKGNENRIELIFDNNIQNKKIDLRPNLPVIIKY